MFDKGSSHVKKELILLSKCLKNIEKKEIKEDLLPRKSLSRVIVPVALFSFLSNQDHRELAMG